MKLLVSLVSEQTIPNVLFIKEKGGDDCCFLFITTEAMEKAEKRKNIIEGAGIQSTCVEKIIVKEDLIQDIQNKLKEFMEKYGNFDQIIVNITGGTKIMSLAAYEFFKNKKNCYIYYIPLGKNEYLQLQPYSSLSHKLKYRLNLREYLTGCGISIVNQSKCLKAKEQAERIMDIYLSGRFKSSLRNKLKTDEKGVLYVKKNSSLQQILKAIKWEYSKKGILTNDEVQYIKSGWFEEFIYYIFLEKLSNKEDTIALNLRLKKGDVENEFDVVFVHENHLYIFEAKTALIKKDEISEALYKLGALRKNFGLSAKAYLATLREKISNQQRERAEILGIKIWSREVFADPKLLEKKITESLNL